MPKKKESSFVQFNGMNTDPDFMSNLKNTNSMIESMKIDLPLCIRTNWEKKKLEGKLSGSGLPFEEYEHARKMIDYMFGLAGVKVKKDERPIDPSFVTDLENKIKSHENDIEKLKKDLKRKDDMLMDLLAVLQENEVLGKRKPHITAEGWNLDLAHKD